MKAEIISIGTELLLGEILDTNTQFLANQLALMGIDLYYISTVGDNPGRLSGVLKQAWQRSELILTTGGLGPTQGDITREGIAELLNEELQVDQTLKQNLFDHFAKQGMEMPQSNIKQATLIPSATVIPNPVGTAPGWWVEKEGRTIIAMPGPPGEMQFMWQNMVVPGLREKTGGIILSRIIKTFGISESRLAELLASPIASSNPTLATYAKADGIHLRITAKSVLKAEAQEMIDKSEANIKAILGDSIWGFDDEAPEDVLGQLLTARALTLAVSESFTGGFLTSVLLNSSQSRSFLKGGLITTSKEAKVCLGLDPHVDAGVASAELATSMADLVRRKFDASIGISIEGSTDSTDAGAMAKIFIAIDSPQLNQRQVQSHTWRLHQVRSRATYFALFDLMKLLR